MPNGSTNPSHAQLHSWYVEARQHNVAHAQVSTQAERLQRWSTVVAGVLAVFTGGVWTADLAKTGLVPSTTVQWVAAMAAFLSAIILAVSAASNWKQDETDHTADKLLWTTVDSDIEELRFSSNGELNKEALTKLESDRAEALKQEHNLTQRDLERASRWLSKNRPDVMSV